ncbi:MAG: GPR endopeptidase [Bacillota bacterium]|nr:GPR endopeptidase [Bacillota bacterium]
MKNQQKNRHDADFARRFAPLAAYAARMDLIGEASALLRGDADTEIAGVSEQRESCGDIVVHTIKVLNDEGARNIGKSVGSYITIEMPPAEDQHTLANIAATTAAQLSRLLPPLNNGTLLVVGLGNRKAVPDALGPAVVELSYATRQLLRDDKQAARELASVCTLAPGVSLDSGIDSAELIRGVAASLKPCALIVVDSLAAASVKRVGTTIQIGDSGITPGSGLGNQAAALDRATLGIPVIAIGVPTVVDTTAIIWETLQALAGYRAKRLPDARLAVDEAACDYVEQQLLTAFNGRLMVTPKDIDDLIAAAAEIIAAAIAIAAHPAADAENYHDYIK